MSRADLRKVLNALREISAPLIVHRGMLDLTHVIALLNVDGSETLPKTAVLFMDAVSKFAPGGVYDTAFHPDIFEENKQLVMKGKKPCCGSGKSYKGSGRLVVKSIGKDEFQDREGNTIWLCHECFYLACLFTKTDCTYENCGKSLSIGMNNLCAEHLKLANRARDTSLGTLFTTCWGGKQAPPAHRATSDAYMAGMVYYSCRQQDGKVLDPQCYIHAR